MIKSQSLEDCSFVERNTQFNPYLQYPINVIKSILLLLFDFFQSIIEKYS